jgi:hypothetical protein
MSKHPAQPVKTADLCLPRGTGAGLLLVVVVGLLAACTSNSTTESTPYGLRADLQGTPPERTWVEPTVHKTVTLPSGEDYTLFNPAAVWILRDGRVCVWDAGDYKLKTFTMGGDYVTAYGEGKGQGPGQMRGFRNVGLRKDSLYVHDPLNRRVSFFGKNGKLGRSQQYEDPLGHFAWSESTRYELYRGPGVPPSMEITTASGRTTRISEVQTQNVSSIVFDGFLHATGQRRAVYAPYYYPLLLTVAPGDTVANAYPTPDYGEAPLPEPRREGSAGQEIVRPPSDKVNWKSELDGGVLSVQQLDVSDEVIAFDLYDIREMQYMHSVRWPLDNASAKYAYEKGLLAVERDTTVDLYKVEHSTP